MKTALRKVVGSALSVSVGIAAGLAVMMLYGWIANSESVPHNLFRAAGGRLEIIAAIAIPIWLLILLPLYMLLPRSSALWRTGLCTTLGGLVGVLIAFLAMFIPGGPDAVLPLWICLVVGAVVGAVTCWFGAATADYFHRS